MWYRLHTYWFSKNVDDADLKKAEHLLFESIVGLSELIVSVTVGTGVCVCMCVCVCGSLSSSLSLCVVVCVRTCVGVSASN